MTGLDAASGQVVAHGDTVEPLMNAGSGISPVAGVTPVWGQSGLRDEGGVFDGAGQQAVIMAQGEADVRAAQAYAQDTRNAMLQHYQEQLLPLGAQYGDDLVMPVVPDNAVVPASSDQYPWPGDEPLPSSAGPDYSYQGNVPQ